MKTKVQIHGGVVRLRGAVKATFIDTPANWARLFDRVEELRAEREEDAVRPDEVDG